MTTGTCILMDLYIFLLVNHIMVSGMRNETTLSLKAQPPKGRYDIYKQNDKRTCRLCIMCMVAIVIGQLPNKHITSKQRRMNVNASTSNVWCLLHWVYGTEDQGNFCLFVCLVWYLTSQSTVMVMTVGTISSPNHTFIPGQA